MEGYFSDLAPVASVLLLSAMQHYGNPTKLRMKSEWRFLPPYVGVNFKATVWKV